MKAIRKIPLEGLIQILQDLFETGADYIDISGVQDDRENGPIDVIKITVKPEYMSDDDESDIEIEIDMEGERPSLSEEDLNNLI
jgi:hypothetical protein